MNCTFLKKIVKNDLCCIIGIALTIRFLLYIWTLIFHPELRTDIFSISEKFLRWDTVHYLNIAEFGYQPTHLNDKTVAFMSRFPFLYPSVIALFHWITQIPFKLSGIIISIVSIIASSILLFKLIVFHSTSRRNAYLGVLYLNIFSSSYFASSAYSESFCILLMLLFFYFITIRDSKILAGLFLTAAVFTKTLSMLLIPTFIYYLFKKWRKHSLRTWDYAWIPIPILSPLIHALYIKYYLKMPGGYLGSKEPSSLHLELQIPFTEIFMSFKRMILTPSLLTDQRFMMTLGWTAIFMLLGLGITLWGLKKIPLEYSLFSLSFYAFFSMISWNVSGPRYLFTLIPIYILLSQIKNIYAHIIFIAFFCYTLLYFTKIFTSGMWAF